jgi:ATP/maltotriose-dependent transcriptional regulator MalT
VKALWAAGYVAWFLGEHEPAATWWVRGLAEADQIGDHATRALLLSGVGSCALWRGDRETADALLHESLSLAREIDARWAAMAAQFWLAQLAWSRGQREAVEQLIGECLAHTQAVGDWKNTAYLFLIQGHLAMAADQLERATHLLQEGLRLTSALGDLLGLAWSLEYLGWVAGVAGRKIRAMRLLGASEALWSELGVPTPACPDWRGDHARTMAEARRILGESRFKAALAAGRAMSRAAAIATALEDAGIERPDSTDPHRLSSREQEVSALVARGYTNRQIADQLVLSGRTVERHIENILGKLGLQSRTQIAAWFLERN